MTFIILSSIALISLPTMFSLDGLFGAIDNAAAHVVKALKDAENKSE